MPLSPLRVLVVDDDAGQRQLLLASLRALGVRQVHDANCGDAACALLRRRDLVFDLVLTDLQMAPGDGFDVIHAAAAQGAVSQVIVMSAVEAEVLGTLSRMVEHGVAMAVTVLPKPISLDQLRQTLAAVPVRSASPARPSPAAPASIDQIRRAIAAREFVVYLEPQVDLLSGAVHGFEALARWQHPQRGVLGPGTFIPVVENRPEMIDLTLLLFDDLLWARQKLHRAGFAGGVSLNVGDYCVRDEHFPEQLAQRVLASGARPSDIMLEITETGIGDDPVRLTTGLARLRMRGFSLALDDFGMGQSTLARMQFGAFSEVKIDREFSMRVGSDRTARSAVASIIELARAQGWRCVAEGIESEDILERLVAMGCREGQGYLFTRPLDVDAAVRWWSAQRPAAIAAPNLGNPDAPTAIWTAPSGDTSVGTPEWLFDLGQMRISWANAAALAFWKARSLDELTARDCLSDLSPAARAYLPQLAERLRGGRTAVDRWTLYIDGRPRTCTMIVTGMNSTVGSDAILVEVPDQLAGSEFLHEAELAGALGMGVLMLDAAGTVLWRNVTAGALFGAELESAAPLFGDGTDVGPLLRQVIENGEMSVDAPLRMRDGASRWHRLALRRARYPGRGAEVVLLSGIDIQDLRGA